MSDNWQLDTRNALWAALGADAAWKRAFGGGTEHRFAKGQTLKRMEIEPAWCPIIAIGPGATELPPVSRRTLADDVDRYNLAVEIATVDLDDCERLVLLFHAAMKNAWGTLCQVRDSRLHQIDARVEYEALPSNKGAQPMWLAAITLVCRYRQA